MVGSERQWGQKLYDLGSAECKRKSMINCNSETGWPAETTLHVRVRGSNRNDAATALSELAVSLGC